MSTAPSASTESAASPAPASGKRFLGFIHLTDGITNINMISFYAACFTGIMLAAFVPQMQVYVFQVFLDIPQSEHGFWTGKLALVAELVIIATSPLWGSWSEKVGRRPVMTAGYVLLAVSLFMFPRISSIFEMFIARMMFGLGIAAFSVMIVTLVADYVRDQSRGKANGLLGVFNGIGAVFSVAVLVNLPKIFVDQGMTEAEAGIMTYNVATGISLLAAAVMWFGLSKINQFHSADESVDLKTQLREGFLAGKDPGVALAYAAAFIARGNVALVGSFMLLWFSNYGTTELGMSNADALSKGALILAIAQGLTLVWAPFLGVMTDKINRVTALQVTLVISVIGYAGTYFVAQPFYEGGGINTMMIICAVMIGGAEVGCIISSGTLIAQQTPGSIRGSVMGFFTMCGALGILLSAVIGGYLYDNWLPQGPFVFFGIIAFFVLIASLFLKSKVVPLNEGAGMAAGH